MIIKRCAPILAAILLLLSAPAWSEVTPQSVSSEAHAKYDAGELDQAEALFSKVLQDFPSSDLCPDAQHHLGWIAYKKQTGQAEVRWQAVVDRYPTSPEAPKALMGIQAGHYKAHASKESRMADFQKVVDLYPNSPEAEEAKFRIGALHKHEPPDFDKALAMFQGLMDKSPSSKWRAEAYVESGMTYFQRYWNQGRKNQADLTKAMEIFTSARTKYPDQGDAVARGELRQAKYYLYSESDPVKARQAFNRILSAYAETTSTNEILYQIAYCSFHEKDCAKCIQLCQDIIANRPASDWNCYLQYFIGTVLLQQGKKVEAKAAFQKAVSDYPGTNWAKNADSVLNSLRFEVEAGE